MFRHRGILIAAMFVPLLAILASHEAQAQGAYSRLQVLLPGENPAPGTPSGKTGSPGPQTAGEPFSIRVRACDTQWNTVSSATNIVQILASDASADLPAPATLVSGERTFTVTLNASGNFTLFAHDQSDNTIPDGTSAPVGVFVIQGFEFSRINQKNQYAGVPMAITVRAVDPSGNTVSGYNGAVELKEITSFGDGRISPSTVTLAGGQWSGSLTMFRADESSINRGNVNIFAYLAASPSINGTSDPFTVHPGPLARLQIVVPGETPLPGSVSGRTGTPASQGAGQMFPIDVFATDDYWNQVPSGDNVRVTSSDAGASTPVTGLLNGGYRQFQVSLGTVGTQTLTVSDLTNGSVQAMTSSAIAVIPSNIDHFEISTILSPVTAGANVPTTIRATDASGNTVPDFQGDAVITANTGPGSVSPSQVTFTNGVWTGDMIFRGAGGAVAFTVSDFSSPPRTGSSNSFQVVPGPFTGLQVILPGQTAQGGTPTGKVGNPTAQQAGTAFTLTVRAVDQFWNRVTGVNDRVALASTDAFAGMPAETTLANGELLLPCTLYRSGLQRIWASDVTQPAMRPDTSSAVLVTGGTFSRLLILAPGESPAPGTASGRTGTATDQSINFSFTVTVLATDQWWNPVGGVTDVARITSNDALAQLPPDEALVDGRAEMNVRLSTGGYQQITVSDVTNLSIEGSTTQVRAISSGFHLEAFLTPSTARAGDPFSLTVKVTNDAGSVIQEINSSVTLEVQNANTRGPGRGTMLTTQFQLLQGQRTVTEHYTFAEPILVVARDDAGNAPAVSNPIVITPGQPAAIHLASNPPWVGGNKHATISGQLVDAFENGVPDQAMTFVLLSGTGMLSPVDSLTDASGVARGDFLSPRHPELNRIRASAAGIVEEMDLQVAFVDPAAPGGHLTNYPNPFHPGSEPTTIAYVLDDASTVHLRIYTLSGDLVWEETFSSGGAGGLQGLNEVTWDGRNGKGAFVASGGYIAFLEAQGAGETLHVMRRKIAVVR